MVVSAKGTHHNKEPLTVVANLNLPTLGTWPVGLL